MRNLANTAASSPANRFTRPVCPQCASFRWVIATKVGFFGADLTERRLVLASHCSGVTKITAKPSYSSLSHLQQCPLLAAGSGGGKSSPGGHTECVSFSPSWSPCSTGSAPETQMNLFHKRYHTARACMRDEHALRKRSNRDNR